MAGHLDPLADASVARDAGHSDAHCEVLYPELGRGFLPSASGGELVLRAAQTDLSPLPVVR
jgi:hypothetical protein